MSNFSVQWKRSNGNLHLRPRGNLDGSSAWELINLIRQKYDGKGRIFIDTQGLREIHPFGCGILKYHLTMGSVPPDRLFFKGKWGFEMAPNGSRVILSSKESRCRCDGNCANCSCSGKRNGQN